MIKTQAKLLQILKNAKFPIEDVLFAYEYGLTLEEARFARANAIPAIDLPTELVFADGSNSKTFFIVIESIEKELVNVSEKEFNELFLEIKKNFFSIQVSNHEAENQLLREYYVEKLIEDYINLQIKTNQEIVIKKIKFKEYEVWKKLQLPSK